jgi:hypothetical protein
MPCTCSETFPDRNNVPQPQYFCNCASGYCQAGVDPFVGPPATCPPANFLVEDHPEFDALCWIAPVWKCNPGTSSPARYGGFSTPEECFNNIYATAMVGPFLCRGAWGVCSSSLSLSLAQIRCLAQEMHEKLT